MYYMIPFAENSRTGKTDLSGVGEGEEIGKKG